MLHKMHWWGQVYFIPERMSVLESTLLYAAGASNWQRCIPACFLRHSYDLTRKRDLLKADLYRWLRPALAAAAVDACGTLFLLLGASCFSKTVGQPLLNCLWIGTLWRIGTRMEEKRGLKT